jgi:hypothetical protein
LRSQKVDVDATQPIAVIQKARRARVPGCEMTTARQLLNYVQLSAASAACCPMPKHLAIWTEGLPSQDCPNAGHRFSATLIYFCRMASEQQLLKSASGP